MKWSNPLVPTAATLVDYYVQGYFGAAEQSAKAPIALFDARYQAYDADLAAIAAITTTSFGRSLLTQSNALAARTTLGLGIGSDVQAYDAGLAAIAALADAAGVLFNDGTGVFSYIGKSIGGNAGSDGFKLAQYDSDGSLACTTDLHITSDGGVGIFTLAAPASVNTNNTLTLPEAGGSYLAATPNGDGSLSLFDLSNIPTDAAGVLTSDGMGGLSWGAGGGGGGLTVGTTTITSGTSGRWLYNNGGVLGEIALGTGVATWLQTPTLANLNSAVSDADLARLGANTFTAAQNITASTLATSALSVAQTWNASGTVCRGFDLNVTDTASATGSSLFRLMGGPAGTTERFVVAKTGAVTINGGGTSSQINLVGTGATTTLSINAFGDILSCSSVMSCNGYQLSSANGILFRSGGNIGLSNSSLIGFSSSGDGAGSFDLTLARSASAVLQLGINHATTATNQTIKAHNVTTGTGADLILKGGSGSVAAGRVCFGTHSAIGAETVTGFITIKDEGGTTRKLAVVS